MAYFVARSSSDTCFAIQDGAEEANAESCWRSRSKIVSGAAACAIFAGDGSSGFRDAGGNGSGSAGGGVADKGADKQGDCIAAADQFTNGSNAHGKDVQETRRPLSGRISRASIHEPEFDWQLGRIA